MRVVLFSRYPLDPAKPRGGVEAVTAVYAKALAGLEDIEVHVVTLERGRQDPLFERQGKVTVHRLPGSAWPQILDILVGPGRRRLVGYLTRLRPDVVHFHETYGLTLGDLAIPHVFTVHGFDHANLIAASDRFWWLRAPLWRLVERYGLARQRHLISISPYVTQMVEPLTRATIYHIEIPVDERFFAIGRQEEGGRILSVGWISARKNTLGLVQAFGRAVRSGVLAQLSIVGELSRSAYSRKVVDYVEQEGLGDRVCFLGRISDEQLRAELARASLFVLPSRQENSPGAIAEAMAAGLPVISSNRCGMPYMVQEGVTGYLVEPEDCDALADRIRRVLADDVLRARMGHEGRLAAWRRFHPDAVARKTVEVYRSLL
jgi:glycosyltransferase involved in cell wall biosynthesis